VAERSALAEVLTRHRLVTAVGPGGVGKMRLAVAVAADVTDRYADGAWYVDLVPVTDTAMVGAAVAAAFGYGEQPGRSLTDTVLAKLAGAEALVVLDNCEHLLDGVAAFVERLLSACPKMTVLATSRARLLVPFEFVFSVPGLSLVEGAGESDAVALFVERAAMAGWSTPYPSDRRRIATICDQLDGVALAIRRWGGVCPPEDCGEPGDTAASWRRSEIPDHEEHESMLEWVGGQFDPDAFDASDSDHRLNPRHLTAI
jgi:predicted ATPase